MKSLSPSAWSLCTSLSALCFALLAVHGPVRADIRDTKHNLTGRATGGAQGADSAAMRRAEREVCVFCHTPSLDESGASRERVVTPQWQRSVEATFAFELWDDIGRADTGTGGAIGSVSMACLSCHDDVQAFGVAPGSGSDHPFGVPYRGVDRGGEKASDYRKRLLIAQEAPVQIGLNISDDEEFRPARTGMINRRQIWWTSVTDTGQRTKNDLPLYPRRVSAAAGNYAVVPFIECTSCHDPHSTREVFLRTSNEGSKLCLTCHVK